MVITESLKSCMVTKTPRVVEQREEFRSGDVIGIEHVDVARNRLQPVFFREVLGEGDHDGRRIEFGGHGQDSLPLRTRAEDSGKALAVQALNASRDG